MKKLMIAVVLALPWSVRADDVESRALTTYLPQDMLETVVRKEGWTELTLKPFGGIRKGDVIRVWAGGLIDRGGAEAPGQNVHGPAGLEAAQAGLEASKLALSANARHAAAILFKTEEGVAHPCNTPGKPLELPLTRENARVWIGFNDQKGAFADNHLGKGRRHELEPLWIRIEIVRIVVD